MERIINNKYNENKQVAANGRKPSDTKNGRMDGNLNDKKDESYEERCKERKKRKTCRKDKAT